MQIGSLNHLTFLPGSAPAGKANGDDTSTDAASLADKATADAALAAKKAAALELTPEQDAAGVVLNLQSEATTAGAVPKDLVYSNGRKTADADSSDADTEAMAQRHSQALERSAGSNTSLSVDANGVLLAKPVSAAEAKAQNFVHHAVTAMRDYADAQERQKVTDKTSDTGNGSTSNSVIPRSLADVQKLAARFKLFA